LIALILGFYRPRRGRIFWEGIDISEWSPGFRRRRFGAVLQEIAVFAGTLRENLTLFGPAPTDSRLNEALAESGAADLVRYLPLGLDTPLGVGGVVLSGGQKQLLGMARLVLSSPDLILLDEASSALDDETENGVRRGLERICRNRATLVVGHRGRILNTVNKMAVLSGGTIRYGEGYEGVAI
jgi:ABC-type bacteriocin/lantibiotic exporter with double-glycine peptidase domain